MPIRPNIYLNNPQLQAAASNIASLFEPPSGADVANYALADERRAKMNQLAWLFENPDDPTASKRSALTGVQGYGQTPDGFTYNVDRGYQASTENNVRDNARAITERQMIEDAATQRLGVGIRLLGEILEALKAGRDLRFGDALLHDDGITLAKHGFFSASEQVRCSWNQVHVWSQDGAFYIGSKDDKKTYAGLSYINGVNIHILEQIIRMAFKKPGMRRLSDLLQ